MKKILIIYFSLTGNTKLVSGTLAKTLNAKLTEIKEVPSRNLISAYISIVKDKLNKQEITISPEKIDLTLFTHIIIGTPVWTRRAVPAIRIFLGKTDFSNKKVILFTTQRLTKQNAIIEMKQIVEKNSGEVIFTFSINTLLFKKFIKKRTEKISKEILAILRGLQCKN